MIVNQEEAVKQRSAVVMRKPVPEDKYAHLCLYPEETSNQTKKKTRAGETKKAEMCMRVITNKK